MKKFVLVCAAVVVSSVLAAPALAANGATSRGVKMQAGPDIGYPDVMRLAPNLKVTIHGCARVSKWCDVEWRGNRGWVPAEALDYRLDRTLLPVASFGPRIGIPEAAFDLAAYWDAHYRQRPWYSEREEWSARVAASTELASAE